MVSLPNNCRCSEIKVSPANWDKKGATTKKPWKIHYRFYDPSQIKPYQVIIKAGINQLKDLTERRMVVRELIKNEYIKLKSEGFNPISGENLPPVEVAFEISPDTLFIKALKKALEKLQLAHRTKKDMGCIIKGVEKAVNQLQYTSMPISQISRKHIKIVLEQCLKNNPTWTAIRYNTYRAYLIMLFKELVEIEAVAVNPVRDIKKMRVLKKLRTVLTSKQRIKIDNHLKASDYRFWLFVHIFFHSGGRLTELMQLKRNDVDLQNQTYKTIIRKSRTHKEVARTIKNVALPYWREYINDAKGDDFLFGVNFYPSNKAMNPDTVTRRWQKRVKKDLRIQVDLYSLKHLNTTETVSYAGEETAAKQNGHASTAMVISTYDVNRPDRQHKILKAVKNKFA